MLRTTALLLLGLASLAPQLAAQRRQLSIEANPVHGAVGYGWVREQSVIGVEVGLGFPQFDRTLTPSDEDLIDFFHVGVFLRSHPARSFLFDGRAQIGFAELRGCSGCLPGFLTGVSGGVFWGGRFKVGTRLTGGFIKESAEPTTFVVSWTPVAALFTHAW